VTPPLRSHIQLPAALWSWLDDQAEDRDCTRSDIIATLIQDAIAKETPTMPDCHRCDHPADWHRHDDSSTPGANGHNSHGSVAGEAQECPYRCIGYDGTVDGPVPPGGRACDCPDMVRELTDADR